MFKALLSNASYEWYTPSHIMDMVYKVFPYIDLDPFSCETANGIVKANRILTKADDAYNCEWPPAEYVFVNPPGSVKGEKETRDNVRNAWDKVMDLPMTTNVLWVGFSIEQLATLQDFDKNPLDFLTVILRKRINFVDGSGRNNASHSNYITLLSMSKEIQEKFIEVFSIVGKIIYPRSKHV